MEVFYLNFQSAFDSATYRLLWTMLMTMGIDGNIIGWIHVLSTSLSLYVWVEVADLRNRSTFIGVLQGSPLETALSPMHIIDPAVMFKSPRFLSADDADW